MVILNNIDQTCKINQYTGWNDNLSIAGQGSIVGEKIRRKFHATFFHLRFCLREDRLARFDKYI